MNKRIMFALIGLVLGLIAWYLLVRMGLVIN